MTTKSIATAAATAALAITILAGCSSVQQPITADPTDATPTAAASETVKPVKKTTDGRADVCSNVDAEAFTLSEDLEAAFTEEEVAAATCEAIRFQQDVAWTNLANPADAAFASSRGQAAVELLRPWMTTRGLKTAAEIAEKAAADEGADLENELFGLTAINLENPDWLLRVEAKPGSPLVGDRSWSDATLALDEDPDEAGRERVDVTITFTDELLLARKTDKKPGRAKVAKTLTLAMSQTDLEDHPWLVDGWSTEWKASKPTLDEEGER